MAAASSLDNVRDAPAARPGRDGARKRARAPRRYTRERSGLAASCTPAPWTDSMAAFKFSSSHREGCHRHQYQFGVYPAGVLSTAPPFASQYQRHQD